jgi:hypothetical protein
MRCTTSNREDIQRLAVWFWRTAGFEWKSGSFLRLQKKLSAFRVVGQDSDGTVKILQAAINFLVKAVLFPGPLYLLHDQRGHCHASKIEGIDDHD